MSKAWSVVTYATVRLPLPDACAQPPILVNPSTTCTLRCLREGPDSSVRETESMGPGKGLEAQAKQEGDHGLGTEYILNLIQVIVLD